MSNGNLLIKTATNATTLTSGCLQLYGGASIQQNLFVGGNIYFGETTSNTDPMYISRSNLTGNITEIAVYIGDDGANSMNLPSGEPSSVDYFSIRSTNNVLSHLFSSTGNYYCSNNINGVFVPKNSGGYISGINSNYMIINAPSNGGVQFNNNGSEMIKIYQSSGTNYIGTGSNNFILNTGGGAIISNSFHCSPNYANSYVINYNLNSTNRVTGNYEIEIATYTVIAGNKLRFSYYTQYGNYFNVQADNSSALTVTLTITNVYSRIYKNGTMISNTLINQTGYTNTYTVNAEWLRPSG